MRQVAILDMPLRQHRSDASWSGRILRAGSFAVLALAWRRSVRGASDGWTATLVACRPLEVHGSTSRKQRRPRIALDALSGERETSRSPLAVLGLLPGASVEELRSAYRAKAKECHPDSAEGQKLDPNAAKQRFIEVHSAYRQLLESGTGGPSTVWSSVDAAWPPSQADRRQDDENEDGHRPPADVEAVWDGRFAWELSAVEVGDMTMLALRAVLWYSLSWGAKCWSWNYEAELPPESAGRDALITALLPLLDEIVRRELRIRHAQAAADSDRVAELLRGRSQRHRAFDEWMQARDRDREGSSENTLNLRERFEVLTEARADITADEGDYPADWDRDEEEVAAVRAAQRQSGKPQQPAARRNEFAAFFRLATRAAARRSSAGQLR